MKNEHRRYAIGNGVITDGGNLFLENGAILINGTTIEKTGHTADIKEEGLEFIDVKGRLVIPGLVNFHHHLYSSLATGLAPRGQTGNFVQILRHLWWPLDAALDQPSVYYSALAGIVEAIKHGATTIFDHHASMGYVRGSLATIAKAFQLAGIKGVLCFETSDRMGEHQAATHMNENLEFWQAHQGNDTIKGMFGLHANLTLGEKTLKRIRLLKPETIPVHVHCGENQADLYYCTELGYQGPVERLHRFGLIDSDSILAHAVHLSEDDYRIIEELQPIVVSNPESNANNQVGTMNRARIKRYVLGTDGMSGDMIQTLRSHYLLGKGCRESFDEMRKIFFDHRQEIQKRFFPESGTFDNGMKADIAVLDYVPVTPIGPDNLVGHLIFGAKDGKSHMTIADGKILCQEDKITFLDEDQLIAEVKKVARTLHRRYYG